MFYSADDDDHDFLSPTGGSKLASLFGADQSMSSGGNEKLTYTAPKEPKKKKPGETSGQVGSAPSVLHAEAVHAYKYVDGKYTSQGKLGAAILGNHSVLDYKILLYVSKQQQVAVIKITPSFAYTIQPNNYASFYDDVQQSWSLMFDSAEKSHNFAKQVGLAKMNTSENRLDSLIIQDMGIGEGGSLEVGDSAEVRYTGWLRKEHSLGEVFDSNVNAEKLFRFKLGKGKVIKGWEEGLIGMKKGSSRLLIVPPGLAYGSQGMGKKVPPNSTLVFDIEVVRVKLAKERDSPLSSVAGSPSPSPVPTQPLPPDSAKPDETNVKTRTKSISEQLEKQTSKSDKAKLISRMAKMGKPMLPITTAGPRHEGSDEEGESVEVSPSTPTQPRPELAPKPQPAAAAAAYPGPSDTPPHMTHMAGHVYTQPMGHPMGLGQPVAQQPVTMMGQPQPPAVNPAVFQGVTMPTQMALYQPPQSMMHPQQSAFQQGMPFQQPPQYPPQQSTPPQQNSDSQLPVLMSETRQQNTEVRLAISKISDKMDRVSEKIDQLQNQGSSLALQGMNSPTMETAVLVHNIQKIVQDNERLKRELFEKSARIEAQNDKIAELLQRNQKYMEQSNQLLEQRNDAFNTTASASQAKVLTLEQEKVELATKLSAATASIGNLQLEINGLKKKEAELQQQLESALGTGQQNKEEFNLLKVQKVENESKISQLTESLREEKSIRKKFEAQSTSLEEEVNDLKSANASLEKALTDRKKKAAAEKEELEQELDDFKTQHEEEITALKNRLRKQKTSTDADTAEKVAQIETEMEKEWQQKCDRMVANAEEKHKRALKEVQEEKAQLEAKLKEVEKRANQAKATFSQSDKEVLELQNQLEEAKLWKDKYDNLRVQATTMKERYEDRLKELDEQIKEERAEAAKRIKLSSPTGGSTDVSTEVKKVMNGVYHSLKEEFDPKKSYQGSQVQSSILETIKEVTLKMMQPQEEEEEDEDEEDGAIETEVIQQTSAGNLMAKPKEKTGSDDKKAQAEQAAKVAGAASNLTKAAAALLGDKGNPYYAAELDQEKEKKEKEKSQSKGKDEASLENTADILKKIQASIVGDKGNPYYKEELDKEAEIKQEKEVPVESVMVAQTASTVSAPPPSKDKEKNKEEKSQQAAAILESSIKLQKAAAAICGDKGNPYYAAELDKEKEKHEKEKQEKEKIEKSQKIVTAAEKQIDVIKKIQASITGDKGNPYYAAELDGQAKKDPKADKEKEKEKEKPMDPNILEAMIASSVIPDKESSQKSSKPKSDEAKTGKLAPSVIPDTSVQSSKQMKEPTKTVPKEEILKEEKMVAAKTAQTSASKGKPSSKKEEPVKKAVASTSKDSKQPLQDKIAASIIPGIIETPGGKSEKETHKVESPSGKSKKHDTKAAPEKLPVTGGRGNPHYAAELAKTEKPHKGEVKADKIPTTGDRGNVFYEEELRKGSKDEDPKSKSKSDDKKDGEKKAEKKGKDGGSAALQDILNDPLFVPSSSGKKEESKKKETTKVSPLNRQPPPLFEDSDKPLFGDDDNIEDTFGIPSSKSKDSGKKEDKKDAKKKEEKKGQTPSKPAGKKADQDDDLRPKPPPLFGDDDDDDDLDWLS